MSWVLRITSHPLTAIWQNFKPRSPQSGGSAPCKRHLTPPVQQAHIGNTKGVQIRRGWLNSELIWVNRCVIIYSYTVYDMIWYKWLHSFWSTTCYFCTSWAFFRFFRQHHLHNTKSNSCKGDVSAGDLKGIVQHSFLQGFHLLQNSPNMGWLQVVAVLLLCWKELDTKCKTKWNKCICSII